MNTRLTLDVSLMKKRRRWLRESTPKRCAFCERPVGTRAPFTATEPPNRLLPDNLKRVFEGTASHYFKVQMAFLLALAGN